jgi:tripartite ATP-independent transporter DctM subunit
MLLLIGSFLLLLVIGVPVALSMAVSSLLYVLVDGTMPDIAVLHRMIGGVDSFPLLAVPFFILAGNLMNIAGVTNRIYQFAVNAVGWMRGGLGQVNIIGSVIFSGMSGTAIADAAGLGTIEIKAMKDHGYPLDFSVGVTAASATLGPIIPPSLPFVIYGMMANVSIGSLFLGGILPGLVMTVMMMLTVAYFARRNNWGSDAPFSWPQLIKSGIEVAVVLATGGAIWGIFVVTEWPLLIGAFLVIAVLTWADWYFKFSAVMALMTPMLLMQSLTSRAAVAQWRSWILRS